MRALALSCVLAVVALAAVASADVGSGVMTRDGWLLFEYESNSATDARLAVEQRGDGALFGFEFMLNSTSSSNRGWLPGQGRGVLLENSHSGDIVVGPAHVEDDGTALEIRRVLTSPFSGRLLIWAAGDVASATWSVTGGSLTFLASGTGSFYDEGYGFDSEERIAIYETATVRVDHQVGGRLPFTVGGHFIGEIGTWGRGWGPLQPVGSQTIVLEGPMGERACPCSFSVLGGPDPAPAGHYIIHRDADRVDFAFPTLLLAGVDVDHMISGQSFPR